VCIPGRKASSVVIAASGDGKLVPSVLDT
jgi:hypothetical protein